MVTKQEVVDGYRFLLGRNPENESVVESLLAVPTFEALRQQFLRAPEFCAQLSDQIGASLPPLNLPPLRIDTAAEPADLQALLDRIKKAWEELGRTEPHWSVLTHERFKQGRLNENRTAFFDSGAQITTMIEAFGARHGFARGQHRTCFELGCGVGRITLQLSKMFERVLAVDISRFHLDVCAEEMRRNDRANVDLMCLTDFAQLAAVPRFDMFCSIIVLQHNPPPVIRMLLRAILDRLNPGGIGVFQIMTYRAGYSFDLRHYLQDRRPRGMEMHVFPQAAAFETVAAAECRVLEVREDAFTGPRRPDTLSNTFFVQKNA